MAANTKVYRNSLNTLYVGRTSGRPGFLLSPSSMDVFPPFFSCDRRPTGHVMMAVVLVVVVPLMVVVGTTFCTPEPMHGLNNFKSRIDI